MEYRYDTTQGKLLTLIAVVLSAGTLLLLLGCQPSLYKPDISGAEAVFPPEASATKGEYPSLMALAPGDVVDVKFFYTPDLNETQMVRPDGKIALQLIGEVEVEGKTPAELRDELRELYATHLKVPEITVVVRLFHDRCVFVGGQVIIPGIVEMPGKMTVLEAIMRAGGFDLREAEIRNVVVIRHRNGERYGYSINLKPALMGNEVQSFYLEPKDIVYVPRTEIAKVNQWIDQHINRIIPDTGFIFRRTMGKTTIGIGSYR